MKQFKLFLWIAGITIAETVLSVFVNIKGITPDLLLAFTIAYAAYERSLKPVVVIAVICGIIASAVGADEFVVIMIAFAVGAVITYMSYDAPHKPAGFIRAGIGTALITAVGGAVLYMIGALSFDVWYFLYNTVPEALINAALAMLIYAALTQCFDIKDTAKKLIIS